MSPPCGERQVVLCRGRVTKNRGGNEGRLDKVWTLFSLWRRLEVKRKKTCHYVAEQKRNDRKNKMMKWMYISEAAMEEESVKKRMVDLALFVAMFSCILPTQPTITCDTNTRSECNIDALDSGV